MGTAAVDTSTIDASTTTSRLGAVTVAAGLLGAAGGLALGFWSPRVTEDAFSYPLSAREHVVFQTLFAVQHLGLIAGVWGVASVAWRTASRPTRAGLVLALTGLLGLTATELFCISAAEAATDSSLAGALGALYGVTSLMIGVGLVLAGTGLARRPVFAGWWGRWIVLGLGVYVFVPLTPALAAPMLVGRLALVVWMLLFAGLGLVLMKDAGASGSRR